MAVNPFSRRHSWRWITQTLHLPSSSTRIVCLQLGCCRFSNVQLGRTLLLNILPKTKRRVSLQSNARKFLLSARLQSSCPCFSMYL
jgi:hypothetical protein